MTHDEMIAVIQAHKDGKVIQYRFKRMKQWDTAASPCWDFPTREYRVKPEPMEIWVNVYPSQEHNTVHTNPDSAKIHLGFTGRTVKFREVLDE